MPVTTLNLGILAHVDAGKTTLTERLLYAAGAIDELGSVDAGTTRTDTVELERRRGITIRSAVASFTVGDVTANLVDTPGHPDFIAEVERALSVLDGAVLVLSAVEGVQPQTRILMRTLQRLRIPTLLFVNKVDRAGAAPDRVLAAISTRLTPRVAAMGTVDDAGSAAARFRPYDADDDVRAAWAEVLAGNDDALLAAYVESERRITRRRLREALAAQAKQALVHPVFFGSAVTGAGVDALMSGLVDLLPAADGDPDGPLSGRVFKIERGDAGEKVAYVRLFHGTVRTRDRVELVGGAEGKVTTLSVFDRGTWVRRSEVRAGEIGKLWGLSAVQVGDAVGAGSSAAGHHFAPPTLAAVVAPRRPDDGAALRVALAELAEQDPLIDVRLDAGRQEISVSLYGEVQKEVIEATLADDYGIEVAFRETSVIHVERPAATGEAVARMNTEQNPYRATIGLRVEPAAEDSGVEFRLDVTARDVPLYIYKSMDVFAETMENHVRRALTGGPHGWRVTDCVVTMVESGYTSPDGPPSTRGPLSTPADFRKLTPLVVARTLRRAGTLVCAPTLHADVEIPVASIGPVLTALGRLDAAVTTQRPHGDMFTIQALLPAARVHELHRDLPNLTGGEGVLETCFAGYRPVRTTRVPGSR
ncbi:MAG: TetM/TetW/TetO/TetS family tetracycline resistance ribosomal protection protein [Streptosporangiales bacterium]|nr:TetM/TetW/TetO/TetS family tetracycline resistance ribosomal protection protein [Streptosporangiales bacterium]